MASESPTPPSFHADDPQLMAKLKQYCSQEESIREWRRLPIDELAKGPTLTDVLDEVHPHSHDDSAAGGAAP